MITRILSLAAVLLATISAAHAQSQDWQRLTFSDLLKPTAPTAEMASIWGDAIAQNTKYFRDEMQDRRFINSNAPAQFLSHTFTDGDSKIIVSLIRTLRACEAAPNSSSSDQIHNMCPVRVTIIGPAGSKTTRSTGCFLDISAEEAPRPDPNTNATFAAYAPGQDKVFLRSIRNGRPLTGCNVTIKIR